ELAKIRDNIGSGETDAVGSNDERMKNIRNAMRLISDTMLYPGESFSTLEKPVPFTAENGYELAHSYEEGAVVDTYGGGICQVSTTLYQAVMAAELAVDERVNHSMIVSYVEPSMDAAISEEGGKDFVFTNNTDAPIYIKGYVAGTVLHFDIYGLETRPENRKVVYRSEVLSKESAPDNFTEDPEKPVGYIRLDQDPHEGVAAEVYKEVYVDNVLESNDWYNASEYNMSPAKYTIGTAGADESLLTALRTAFETESLEMVYRVLAENNITYKMTTAEAEAEAARTASGEVNP
ncbi:MAG: VanW family protein, partial [Lachnospiraceae bacterium]|nr:VanW family protein [Lachnospiraceae bacterium]